LLHSSLYVINFKRVPSFGEAQLYKHRFSGFYQTELDDILRRLGIRNLIFTGCTTSVCVDSTIRDAMFRDYRCELLLIESVACTQGIDDRVGIEPNP
jgi:nicotinamidase-related amidase